MTKYYFAGSTRIALQKYVIPQNMTVEYFLGDHLSSTSLTTDANGAKVSDMRYCEASLWDKPLPPLLHFGGATRGRNPLRMDSVPLRHPRLELTKYTYTGQFSHMDDPTTAVMEGFGLLFYNARWYDPVSGRFTWDCLVAAGIIILNFIDYGWTRYDIYQSANVMKGAKEAYEERGAEAIVTPDTIITGVGNHSANPNGGNVHLPLDVRYK
ncbi:MAG: hypothetical protein ACOYYF_03495 [Chloroflexota bacterium]|nr:hypothetical protein [Chloroflexota bacterium]MBI5703739.1 hypothetical protein [Chloroflexota bacterium]